MRSARVFESAVLTALPTVNVLLVAHGPTVKELGALGVSRISVGGTFAFAALGALAQAARELLGDAGYTFWDSAATGRDLARRAFGR